MLQSRQLAKWIIALLLLFPLAGLLPSTTPVKAYSLPHVVITDCSSGQNIANAFGTYTPIWQSGGTISFNCGNSPVTIPVTTTLQYYGYYPDQNVLTIDGGGLVTLDGLSTPTIFKGVNLNLENINLTRSNSGQGRGIEVGNLNMSNVTISNQTDSAIFARTAYITNSTFYNNSSATQGGAISIYPLDLVIWINGSSFISNTANQGGAIYAPGSLLYVVNSTISGNKATDKGGAIYAQSHAGGIEIHNTTIYNNEANFGGGFFFSTAQAEFANTIIAGNHSLAITDTNTNCFGNFAMTDFGNNLEDNNTCNFSNANHDLINTDPNLSPLGNYGGPTKTHLLLPGSPAIDAGNNDICLHQTFLDNLYLPPWQYNIDQRGIPRPQGAACDKPRNMMADTYRHYRWRFQKFWQFNKQKSFLVDLSNNPG
jgi:predicted outer membrane repeat protein